MEHQIISYMTNPENKEAYEEFQQKTRMFVKLDTKELCSALNEQIVERRRGKCDRCCRALSNSNNM